MILNVSAVSPMVFFSTSPKSVAYLGSCKGGGQWGSNPSHQGWGELKNELEFNSIPEFKLKDFHQTELKLKENELNLIFLYWCDLVLFTCGPQSNPRIDMNSKFL